MPLQFVAEPFNGRNLVEERLEAYERRFPSAYIPTAGIPARMPRPYIKPSAPSYAPHPVYALRIDNLLKGGKGLAAARPWGFYYALDNVEGLPVARAHIMMDQSGLPSFGSLSFGIYSSLAVPALDQLFNLPIVQDGAFEARCLRCKAIFFAAIWLKSTNAGTDLIYPLESKYNILKGEPPYLADDFMAALPHTARKFVRRNAPEGQSATDVFEVAP